MASKQSKSGKNIIFEDESSLNQQPENFSESKPSTVENIISIILGLAVVFVIGAMIINVIRNRNTQETTSQEEQKRMEQAAADATISARYTVQSGDTLWSIAEKHYSDGFKYKEIEKANNLTGQTSIETGTELIIPKIENADADVTPTNTPTTVTSAPTATNTPSPTTIVQGPTGPTGIQKDEDTSSTSTDRQYSVVKGDTLWDISVKRYNNGYRWVEIAKMNSLKNPHLIHPGNVLMMP